MLANGGKHWATAPMGNTICKQPQNHAPADKKGRPKADTALPTEGRAPKGAWVNGAGGTVPPAGARKGHAPEHAPPPSGGGSETGAKATATQRR